MNEQCSLSPAQTAFCRRCISGFSTAEWECTPAGQAASDRYFVRIHVRLKDGGQRSYILVLWDSSKKDWQRCIAIQRDFASHTDILPELYAHDERHGLLLEEDLGATMLKTWCLRNSGDGNSLRNQYRRVLDRLVEWQRLDPQWCATVRTRSMDRSMFLWESDYFTRHCIIEYFGLEALIDTQWHEERRLLANEASTLRQCLLHRDFQSENIMLTDNKVRFVDFQGARMGPPLYDVASLLFDPYISVLEQPLHQDLFAYYRERAPWTVTMDSLRVCALQRLMQALGAYTNLVLHKNKERYRAYILPALQRLFQTISPWHREFPRLYGILQTCLRAGEM